MSNLIATILLAVTALLATTCARAHGPSDAHTAADIPGHAGAEHDAALHIDISPAMAERAGIRTHTASAGTIAQSLRVYGNVSVPPGQMVQVRARFPGVVRAVNVQLGDTVRKGDLLASVESNDSLRSYALHAPISGVVQALNVAPGDLATESPLLTLLDDSALSLELKIFPQQRAAVHAGQTLRIVSTEPLAESQISHLMPVPGAPYVIARTPLDNTARRFAPGDVLAADIVLALTDAAVVVNNDALQQIEGETGVFVETEDGFVFQPITLGRRDTRHTEVLEGLTAGTRYVSENSYLIKADLEKAGATHEH